MSGLVIERSIRCLGLRASDVLEQAPQFLEDAGYFRDRREDVWTVYSRRYTPRWAVVLGFVLAVPTVGISLLLLLVRHRDECKLLVEDGPQGVVVHVQGMVTPAVAGSFERLSGTAGRAPDAMGLAGFAFGSPEASAPARPGMDRGPLAAFGISAGSEGGPAGAGSRWPGGADQGDHAGHGERDLRDAHGERRGMPSAEPARGRAGSPAEAPAAAAGPLGWIAAPGSVEGAGSAGAPASAGYPDPGAPAYPAAAAGFPAADRPAGSPERREGYPQQGSVGQHAAAGAAPGREVPSRELSDREVSVGANGYAAAGPNGYAGAGPNGYAAAGEPYAAQFSSGGSSSWPPAGPERSGPDRPGGELPVRDRSGADRPVDRAASPYSAPDFGVDPSARERSLIERAEAEFPSVNLFRSAGSAAPGEAAGAGLLRPRGADRDPEGSAHRGPEPGPAPAPQRRPAVRLLLDSGQRVDVTGFGLLGRSPSLGSEDPAGQLITIDDPGMSLSKTHLAFGLDGSGGFWVQDRHSTNGTSVVGPSGQLVSCPAGVRQPVVPGSRVLAGRRSFIVEAAN